MNRFDQLIYNFVIGIFKVFDTKTVLFFKMVTTLGSTIVICTIIFSLFLLFKKKKYFLHTGIACLLGVIIESILKIIIKKPRPTDEFWPLTNETTYSFPSGHSFMSMVLYGMLIYFVCKEVKNKKLRYFAVCIFSLIIFLVGLSRIYLGVHYATDVVGGYILGLVFLVLYIKLVIEKNDRKEKKIKSGLKKSKIKTKKDEI